VRTLLLATIMLLAGAPAAHAAVTVEMDVDPVDTSYGDPTEVFGTVKLDGAPYGRQPVQLQGRRWPFDEDYRVLDEATTLDDGTFSFTRELGRNWDLRVVSGDVRSEKRRVFVFPGFQVTHKDLGSRRVRLTARYRVPRGTKLRRPTIFYLARRGAKTAPEVARRELVRVRPGRYRSSVVVRIPKRWRGNFQYAGCFRVTSGSGMGDLSARCPKRYRF
jgi:hypothetical protein